MIFEFKNSNISLEKIRGRPGGLADFVINSIS